MIPQQPTESEQARALVAADVDTTADLPDENTADLSAMPADDRPPASDSAAVAQTETTANVETKSTRAPLPKNRALGFFAFAACALVATFFATQRPIDSRPQTASVVPVNPIIIQVAQPNPTRAADASADSREKAEPRQAPVTKVAQRAAAPLGIVTFASRSFATSERALAAVFIIERKQVTKGRVVVRWAAHSGSADAGIDFSDASGTAQFADGQRQLAIYVPLRNDLLSEQDETFKVCLRSPQQARIGGRSCAEATIRDDDSVLRSAS